jgi:hypothetical protein
MQQKLARLPKEGPSVWIDPEGYQQAIVAAEKSIEAKAGAERTQVAATE